MIRHRPGICGGKGGRGRSTFCACAGILETDGVGKAAKESDWLAGTLFRRENLNPPKNMTTHIFPIAHRAISVLALLSMQGMGTALRSMETAAPANPAGASAPVLVTPPATAPVAETAMPAKPALQFEAETLTFNAAPGAFQQPASFKFTNTSSQPVTITNVHASCGCTTTKLDKKTYQAGETGQIDAVLTFGPAKGTMRKTITVSTDDPARPTLVLTMVVAVPELMTFSARGLNWKLGDAPERKVIVINVVNPEPIRISSVNNPTATFLSELKELEPGRRYELAITPVSTEQRGNGSLTVVTDFPAQSPQSYMVQMRIY